MSVIDFGVKPTPDFSPIPDQILEETIIPQFERIVEKHANRMAIKDANYSLTYRELNNAINHLAHLILQTVGNVKSPVAFLFDEEIFSIVALMAIIKASKPVVGLHSGNSEEQLGSFLIDSDAALLITSSKFKTAVSKIIGGESSIKVLFFDEMQTRSNVSAPEYKLARNDLYGIFYTSGSTGKPKGSMVGHLYRSQSSQYMNNEWYFSASDHITLLTSVCFSASCPSVFGALLSGALLCIFDLRNNSAQQALDWIFKEEITVFRSTPSIFRAIFGLASDETIFSKIRFMTLGGEPVSETDIQLFKAHTEKDCVLINNYASTETGSICHYPVRHTLPEFQGFLPAGFPAPGKDVMIVDEDGNIIKNGQEGEIVVRSRYLSLGYWKQPELTAEKFHTDPVDANLKIYFTGDRGHWREDGAIEVVGRKDTQVKIRGYRVQLEAIDRALRSLNYVEDAATLVHKDALRGQKLVAYFSASGAEKVSISQLRKDLSQQLSNYMMPSAFVQLDSLPRTATGKLARLRLPAPSRERPDLVTKYIPPKTELEIQITNIWQDMLDIEQIGVEDNFFELGGDSLLALEMTLEVEKQISRPIPQAFFAQPNIAHLVNVLQQELQPAQSPGTFHIASHRKNSEGLQPQKKEKTKNNKLKKLITRRYSIRDFDKLTDLLVGRYLMTQPYPEAVAWGIRWSNNSFVRNMLYAGRYAIFAKWMEEVKGSAVRPADIFHLSILNNLHFGISKYLGGKEHSIKPDIRLYQTSKYVYWRSLGALIESIPEGQTSQYFPLSGSEHLLRAYQRGKGVILLSFHGVPTPGRFAVLEKCLCLEKIPTVSYHIPVRQSKYQYTLHEIPESAASTLNAEIALFAQRLLQQGRVINIISDTHDYQGKTYKTLIAGRAYQMKGGFAELAINTGAAIIPHFRYAMPNGNIMFNILPPLQFGGGSRQEQVENLINQYAAFIEHAWQTHPEALNWHKMKTHLKRTAGS